MIFPKFFGSKLEELGGEGDQAGVRSYLETAIVEFLDCVGYSLCNSMRFLKKTFLSFQRPTFHHVAEIKCNGG